MKISLITVSFNSSATIKDTIQSVHSQDYKKIDYIVVDGSSKDGEWYSYQLYDDLFKVHF